ncbi:MAG TPA: hypothetical protein PLI09_08980 [Candidatus Hydrogenedentes bacterium]|nr:hypothetical protein [Candidatus Hydrogenedentota bacterium]
MGFTLFVLLPILSADAIWSSQAESFALGPVPAMVDLRNMLTQHLVKKSCALLDATAQRRRDALAAGQFNAWRASVREAVLNALGPMPFGKEGCPLNVRVVSRHEREYYTIENVLFESLPGYEVNASVYLPRADAFPPPWPGIVIPVGHSAKTRESYQKPAQAFTRMGYLALTFDPPGQGGEKRPGNDHFSDGVRCYLTGHSSNRYFIIDALRCIDYLETRPDVDMKNGVGMTGVSGGGMTTMWAMVLDNRITAAGPSCCAVPRALHPILDNYAECPEVLAFGRFSAFDDADLFTAAIPTPVLLMAGAKDEVFTADMSRSLANELKESFTQAKHEDQFSFFLDPGGHNYSLAMAVEFTKWMDHWVQGIPERKLPAIAEDSLEMVPDDLLACHPRTDCNMYTINKAMAQDLREHRSFASIQEAVRAVINVKEMQPAPECRAGAPSLVWFHYLQELMLTPEPGIELPATLLYPAKAEWRGAAVLYFDDRGRWTDLRTSGPLAGLTGFIDANTNGPAILTVDVRGWGDSHPADLRYDIAGWGGRGRWIEYVSAAMGDPVLAMRVRDGLSALAWLRAQPHIDPAKIIAGGHGMGGVIALHLAALDSTLAGVFAESPLATFESLAASENYSWSPEDFLPGVLKHYDLPELAAALTMPALIAQPLDAAKKPLPKKDAEEMYQSALRKGEKFSLIAESDAGAIQHFVQNILK